MHITVVYSLPTNHSKVRPFLSSDEDTKESALEVAEALEKKGASVELLAVSETDLAVVDTIHADCIFNVIEWTGLDLPLAIDALQRMEKLHIPITGASAIHYALTTDKISQKKALGRANVPTALWQAFQTGNETIRPDMLYPAIVKPSLEHCSIGISKLSIAHNPKELRSIITKQIQLFGQPVYAEEFIIGKELQVSVYEENGNCIVLPPAEITYDKADAFNLLSFESRWIENHPEFKASHVKLAKLSGQMLSQVQAVCRRAYRAIGYLDYARFDIRVRGDVLYFLEANSNPGLGDSADYGMTVSYKAAGMTFADFVWKIVESAMRRKNQ